MAEILPALTPSVTSLLCWSSLNSIDKSGKLCLSVESFFVRLGYSNFRKAPFMAAQSDPETRKVPQTEKKLIRGRQEQIGVTKTKIISHLQDIKCYTCLVCIALCVIILQHPETHLMMFFI